MDKISNIYTDSHYSWFPSKFLSILHVLQKKWLEVMLFLDWNCKNVIKLAHEACEIMLYRPACFNFLKKLESRLEGLNTATMPPCLLLIKAKINNIHSCTHVLQVYTNWPYVWPTIAKSHYCLHSFPQWYHITIFSSLCWSHRYLSCVLSPCMEKITTAADSPHLSLVCFVHRDTNHCVENWVAVPHFYSSQLQL